MRSLAADDARAHNALREVQRAEISIRIYPGCNIRAANYTVSVNLVLLRHGRATFCRTLANCPLL
jgi:hypothetical protein